VQEGPPVEQEPEVPHARERPRRAPRRLPPGVPRPAGVVDGPVRARQALGSLQHGHERPRRLRPDHRARCLRTAADGFRTGALSIDEPTPSAVIADQTEKDADIIGRVIEHFRYRPLR